MRTYLIVCVLALTTGAAGGDGARVTRAGAQPAGKAFIVFDILQDLDVIRHSFIGEPPQFAIWLEDPDTHRVRTVFVTRRSAKGKWVGKTRCPVSLPRWFDVFKEEFKADDLPTYKNNLPDALSGATPKGKAFSTRVSVESGSRWICWIEMNLSGDFNEAYRPRDDEKKVIDVHLSGQPPLIYRAELVAVPGEKATPSLIGQSALNKEGKAELQTVNPGVTTARNVFSRVGISVVENSTAG